MSVLRSLARNYLLSRQRSRHPGLKVVNGSPASRLNGFYSQEGQDAFLYSEFFNAFESDHIPKVFVDIGCNHPTKFSNSYFFEKHLGFKCIAIDPLPTYADMWKEVRPRSLFHQVAVGSTVGIAQLRTPEDPTVSNAESHSTDMFSTVTANSRKGDVARFKEVNVPIVTAASLLDRECISSVGILSVDVEGFEMEVLKGYDFKRHPADIVLVENNANGRMGDETIREYLMAKGLSFYARFWGLDDVFVSKRMTH